MAQTQTETPIENYGGRRVRPPEEILGEDFFAPTMAPKIEKVEKGDYICLGLSSKEERDVFYTLRKGTSREIEAAAAEHSNINWAVKILFPREDYSKVPNGLAEHEIISQCNGLEGRASWGTNSYIDLRNYLLDKGHQCRDPNDGERIRTYRISRY
ncbi:MAG: hypothetical protein ABH840_04285 [Nanoarchaeota archaeon]